MLTNNFVCFIPEFFFLSIIIIALCASLIYAFTPNKSSINFIYAMYLQIAIYTIFLLLNSVSSEYCIFFFSYESSKIILFSKIISAIIFFLVTVLIFEYKKLFNFYSYEFFFLFFLSFIGLLFLLSSCDIISFYLAIELYNLAIYCTIALRRRTNLGLEAAIKYFIFGSLSSTFLLFSFSIFYAISGCLAFTDLELFFYSLRTGYGILFYVAFFLFFSSFFIKISAPPYHFWAVDVYIGAPLVLTLFISLLPKFVLIFVLFKMSLYIFSAYVVNNNIYLLLIILLSLVIGLLGAVYQTKLKSMIIYSSIFNLSFLLVGIYLNNIFGIIYFFIFMVIYIINVFSFFSFLLCLVNWAEDKFYKSLNSLSALVNTQPWLVFLFLISILSLMGLPPTAGFFAKLNFFFFFFLITIWCIYFLFSFFSLV